MVEVKFFIWLFFLSVFHLAASRPLPIPVTSAELQALLMEIRTIGSVGSTLKVISFPPGVKARAGPVSFGDLFTPSSGGSFTSFVIDDDDSGEFFYSQI